ncbi:MAG: Gfo/Idh/MocA family oxidoreductase [Anaerolineales bacterium]|jgi:predicted dehydrogenase|nr:Gfo/Idh/MocA family oxidoreductase [Anaerolineales bacterium]
MKVGIAGAGFMGVTHAAGWAATNAQIAGLVAETVEEARPLADQYGIPVYKDYQALLKDVDVIDICTPTHLHAEMVLQAAAAGVQVVCEKPLARSTQQAQEIIQACQAAGVQLLVAHVVRFFPEYALARAAVKGGEIGRVGVIRLQRGSYRPKKPSGNWFLDEAKSGGILLDLMIHDFDYARWVAGEVESVYAKKITAIHADAPVDYGLAILKHRSGALSHIAGAWAYPPPTFRTSLEIFGDAGLIEFDSAASAPILNLIQKGRGDAPDVGLPSSPVSESPYTTQIKEFYASLVGGPPARIAAIDGLAAVQIAEAAMQSARSGLPVQLEPLAEVRS